MKKTAFLIMMLIASVAFSQSDPFRTRIKVKKKDRDIQLLMEVQSLVHKTLNNVSIEYKYYDGDKFKTNRSPVIVYLPLEKKELETTPEKMSPFKGYIVNFYINEKLVQTDAYPRSLVDKTKQTKSKTIKI